MFIIHISDYTRWKGFWYMIKRKIDIIFQLGCTTNILELRLHNYRMKYPFSGM